MRLHRKKKSYSGTTKAVSEGFKHYLAILRYADAVFAVDSPIFKIDLIAY